MTRLGHTKLPHMSKPRPVARTLIVLVALVVLVALAAILSMMVGSNPISAPQVVAALVDRASDPGSVVWGSRVPRTVLGLLVGAALGLAGAVMQGQTRNPLADPGVLGVSAGAVGAGGMVTTGAVGATTGHAPEPGPKTMPWLP